MIDFQNASFMKLKPVANEAFAAQIMPMFIQHEQILQTFQGIRTRRGNARGRSVTKNPSRHLL